MLHFKGNAAPAPSLQQMLSNPIIRRKPIPQLQQHQPLSQQHRTGEPKEKFMRLRGKMRILHNAYLQNGDIADRDADVVFICSDGKARAHKVILATVSPFFNDLFYGQKAGSMSSVLVPDVSLSTMKIILLLAYKDNLNLTKKQMKDVALHLTMFGMDLKSFVFDENNLAEQSGTPQPMRKPPPMTVRPNPPPQVQPQQIQRQIGSITISGTRRLVQPGLTVSRASIGTSSGEDEDYKYPFQGYDAVTPPPPLKQIRLTPNPQGFAQAQLLKPKPAAIVGNFRRIAPKPTTDALPIQPAMNMTIGTQEIQFEDNDNDDDDGQVLDPEQGRLMIQEWMQNVGQEDGNTRGGSTSLPPQRNQCLICNNIFENPEKWKWHESHHVGLGIFKCAFCDDLFSTSRKVYQHEMMEHGVSGSGTPLDEPPPIPADFQIVQGRKRRFHDDTESHQDQEHVPRMTLVRTANGTHYRRIPTPISKKLLSKYAKKPITMTNSVTVGVARNFSSPTIAVGSTEGEEFIEDRKMKQLHWVYVCNKCQTCSDSLGKAQAHYNKCFPEKTEIFEKSVMKYRQGFYGRCRCPLCPRRYTTNHGYTIHCGHVHNDFRRKFQHCSQNDMIACISCRRKFELPIQFHAHLGDDEECNANPEYSASDKSTKWIGNEMPGEKRSPPTSKKELKLSTPSSSKSQAKIPQGGIAHGRTGMESQARSTRLANRRTMTHEAEIPEEEFVPVDCPICGSNEKKIVSHLHAMHKEMELGVARISDSALRCLKCAISFGISDLVSHDTYCCIRSKQFQHIKERKLQHPKEGKGDGSGEKGTPTSPNNNISLNPPIPEGIGTSPVDTMEHFDHLTAPEAIRNAMRCGVCGRINSKLGTISECLKSHGIYRCALCFNSYSDKSVYSIHLRSVHTQDNGRLKCPLCDKAQFVNAGQVAGHMYNVHWENVFRQLFLEDKTRILQKKAISLELKTRQDTKKEEVKDKVIEQATPALDAPNEDVDSELKISDAGDTDTPKTEKEEKDGSEDVGGVTEDAQVPIPTSEEVLPSSIATEESTERDEPKETSTNDADVKQVSCGETESPNATSEKKD